MAKPKEFPVEVKKDVNDCWSGSAYLLDKKTNKVFCVSCAVAPGTHNNQAKPQIRERLKELCAERIELNPNYVRITHEEANKIDM